jgi:hypothetical protein
MYCNVCMYVCMYVCKSTNTSQRQAVLPTLKYTTFVTSHTSVIFRVNVCVCVCVLGEPGAHSQLSPLEDRDSSRLEADTPASSQIVVRREPAVGRIPACVLITSES